MNFTIDHRNAIEMYSIHNEGKHVIAERLIRNLKKKQHKNMTSVSQNVYIDTLDDIVIRYNNTYHSTIKVKPFDVKPHILTLVKRLIIKIVNLKLVILLEYINKKFFCKRLHSKVIRRSFYDKKVKNTVPWTNIISDLNGKQIVGTFYEKESQKKNRWINQRECIIEKVIKRRGNKLFVKWKEYNNSYNSWMDKEKMNISQNQNFQKQLYKSWIRFI